jgi:hypothetical protein
MKPSPNPLLPVTQIISVEQVSAFSDISIQFTLEKKGENAFIPRVLDECALGI